MSLFERQFERVIDFISLVRSIHSYLPFFQLTSFPFPSRTAAHVNPAEVVPTPVVRTDRGQSAAANLRT